MPAQQYTYDKPTKRWIHRYKTAIVVDGGGDPPAGQVAGALPIGEASYTVPPGAIFVSPGGNNTNDGSEGSPVQTLARAVQLAPVGGTVVLRAGEYTEGGHYLAGNGGSLAGVMLNKRGLTIQNYPGEAAWMDGSQVVSGWSPAGAGKWSAPFTLGHDRTQTNTRGTDSTSWPGGETFVNSTFPYASWPEQIFVDGQPLEHVGSASEVGPGKFFVQGGYLGGSGVDKNYYTSTAYIIGDDPTGKEVRISVKARALQVSEKDVTIRGIGIRRYNAALCEFGTIYLDGYDANSGFSMENVVVRDISNEGLHGLGTNSVIRKCDFIRCGNIGISGAADDVIIESCYFKSNVSRRYNYGPASGAVKFMFGHRLKLRDNRFEDNFGPGFWADSSVWDCAIYRNDFVRCWGNAIGWEISAKVYIVDNVFIDTGNNSDIRPTYSSRPLWLSGSDNVFVWNNTFVNSDKFVHISRDPRNPFNPSNNYGRDPRMPDSFFQTEMKWSARNFQFYNNLFYKSPGTNAVESAFYSTAPGGDATNQYQIQTGGNLYNRLANNKPTRFANGQNSSGDVVGWFSMTGNDHLGGPSWSSITGEVGSQLVTGRDVVESGSTTYAIKPVESAAVNVLSLPAEVAARCEKTAGTTHLGAWWPRTN